MEIKSIFIYFFTFLVGGYVMGQSNTVTSKSDNDPKAKLILDKLKKQYDSYKSMEVKFELELELPNQPKEVQKGVVIQDGSKYQIKLKDQEIYADGKNVWIYLKKNKEVQITDMSDGDSSDFLSPKQMMTLYQKGEYLYSIVEERKVEGTHFVDIEFKPVSKKSDFTKMRLTIDKKANKMIYLRVFSRDGSRYSLKVGDIIANKKYESSCFTFNTKSVQGIHIEDLRMD